MAPETTVASADLLTEQPAEVPADSAAAEGMDPRLAEFISRVIVPLLVQRLHAMARTSGAEPASVETSEVVH